MDALVAAVPDSGQTANIDVIVVSYNSRDHLRTCVEPLSRFAEASVIVADSASPDRSLDAIADLPVSRLQLAENRGFASACNAGVQHGKSPYVLLLNPDTRLDPRGMVALRAALEEDPQRGAVGPRIVDENGVTQHSIRRHPRAVSSYAQALFLHRIWPNVTWTDEIVRDPAAYELPHEVDWISGACIMLRRSALEALGGLDSGFFLYREDADLCRRLGGAGYTVWFEPRATCVHIGGASYPREALYGVLAESRIRYAQKHGGSGAARVERAAVVLRGTTHAIFGPRDRARRVGHINALRVGLTGRRTKAGNRGESR